MSDPVSDKDRRRLEREARLAKNLRDNLRRRKAVSRKSKDKPSDKTVTDAPESP